MSRSASNIFILSALAVLFSSVMVYQRLKPLPTGVSVIGPEHGVPAESVTFLADRTYVDGEGVRHSEQQIFDEIFRMVDRAERYILVDFFLFNSWQGAAPETTRALAGELAEALAAKKSANPEMVITVISDPINTVYGGAFSPEFDRLEKSGVPVVLTDLTKLRDSNPLYSAPWRTVLQRFGNVPRNGVLPHPFATEGNQVTARSWLALLNFKANHRKVIVADTRQSGGRAAVATLVTSANPHNGSSAHGNIAVKVEDKLWRDVVASEQAVGEFLGVVVPAAVGEVDDRDGDVAVQLLTEGAIRSRLTELLDAAGPGDMVDMTMFYLSERSVIEALVGAAERGARIRLALDPNKDAFGHTKNGVPNRPVADELRRRSEGQIQIRWCDTHGEQCHSKMVVLRLGGPPSGASLARGGRHVLVAGSANLTRRNIADYNLETNVLVAANEEIGAIAAARAYFEDVWGNEGGRIYTTDYETYADDSLLKRFLYRVQEATGLSSF